MRGRTLRLLAALVLGIGAGLLARRLGWLGGAAAIGQIGQLWLNGLRMTLVPLVFCLMTAGVAEIARTAAGGKVARVAVAVFLALLLIGSVLGVVTVLGLMRIWPVAALRVAPAIAGAVPPSLLAEIVALVPANPVAAAAEGAMAPLIVFAAVFGAALARVAEEPAALVLGVLKAISAALLVVVGWVLWLAPAGIFCLLVATVATVGSDGAKGLLQYAVLTSIVPGVGIVVAQLLGLASGAGPFRFTRAAATPQTLALTTQSSSACLPALLEAAAGLGLPPAIVSAMMPLAVTTFRFGNVFTAVAVGLVGANLFGVHPAPGRIVAALLLGILTNIGSVGVPGAAVLLAAWGPIFLALGAPLEALTLYIAIITVPDMLITIANVTADLAATSLIARWVNEP